MPLTQADIQPALPLWPGLAGGEARLVNHSENQTFIIQALSGERFSLRVHRPGYQTVQAIESELAWLGALHRDTDLSIPTIVLGRDGKPLQQWITPAGEPRLAVLFGFVEGKEPGVDETTPALFHKLGRVAAILHTHATAWTRPAGFGRPVWDAPAILAPDGLWGNWRQAPDLDGAGHAVLLDLERTLVRRLTEYGTSPDRFGLIHADMRLGNLLVERERLTLIDFDDCGWGWFTYDFAAAISFHETSPLITRLKAAWLEGYAALRTLSASDLALIDTMVMLRRMALLAWISSHAETALARAHTGDFAQGTVLLARRYLEGRLWPA
jgi:Ser/Thr protein kinase RdoA (MazF antagonist)